ncbi:hypothetical protein V6N13_001579 [Hibiscus sabdariffa]
MQKPVGTTNDPLLEIQLENVSTRCSAKDVGSVIKVSTQTFTILTSCGFALKLYQEVIGKSTSKQPTNGKCSVPVSIGASESL